MVGKMLTLYFFSVYVQATQLTFVCSLAVVGCAEVSRSGLTHPSCSLIAIALQRG
jgi:hypothetical protein